MKEKSKKADEKNALLALFQKSSNVQMKYLIKILTGNKENPA